jgi:hypothetical protein
MVLGTTVHVDVHLRDFYFNTLTLSVLGHMAAIVLRPFSGNFTRSETHAVNNSEVLSYFFTCIA